MLVWCKTHLTRNFSVLTVIYLDTNLLRTIVKPWVAMLLVVWYAVRRWDVWEHLAIDDIAHNSTGCKDHTGCSLRMVLQK
jgi:hypothetical protein